MWDSAEVNSARCSTASKKAEFITYAVTDIDNQIKCYGRDVQIKVYSQIVARNTNADYVLVSTLEVGNIEVEPKHRSIHGRRCTSQNAAVTYLRRLAVKVILGEG
jgi:DNA-directed RNA polymerase specialized sigma subunit